MKIFAKIFYQLHINYTTTLEIKKCGQKILLPVLNLRFPR